MSVRNIALIAAAVALGSPAAYAQTTPEAAPAAAAASAPMMDCKGMARHDHGADKGMPMNMPAGCAASPAKVKAAKAKAGHDHAKFHKLM